MRITAPGTGLPNQNRAAASVSYLVELGNGDRFLFAVDSGKLTNRFSLPPDLPKDDCVLPPGVTQARKDARRTDRKHPSRHIPDGKLKGYIRPPMPKSQRQHDKAGSEILPINQPPPSGGI